MFPMLNCERRCCSYICVAFILSYLILEMCIFVSLFVAFVLSFHVLKMVVFVTCYENEGEDGLSYSPLLSDGFWLVFEV